MQKGETTESGLATYSMSLIGLKKQGLTIVKTVHADWLRIYFGTGRVLLGQTLPRQVRHFDSFLKGQRLICLAPLLSFLIVRKYLGAYVFLIRITQSTFSQY
jgi:hypothetical protein